VGFIVRHVPRVGKNCPKNHQEILINPEDFVKGGANILTPILIFPETRATLKMVI